MHEEGVLLGFFQRTKDFLNIKSTRTIRDVKENYQAHNKNGKPLKQAKMFYIGIQKDATSYSRNEYGLSQFVSEAGGFIAFVYRASVFLVAIVCYTNVNSKLMYF